LSQTPNLENILHEAINTKDKHEIIHSTLDNESDSSSEASDSDENNIIKKDSDGINKKSSNNNNNNQTRFSIKDDQLSITINEAGAMTYNLYNLVKEMNSVRSSYSLSPGALFSLVCKKLVAFKN
jgi:hypothetical protein